MFADPDIWKGLRMAFNFSTMTKMLKWRFLEQPDKKKTHNFTFTYPTANWSFYKDQISTRSNTTKKP